LANFDFILKHDYPTDLLNYKKQFRLAGRHSDVGWRNKAAEGHQTGCRVGAQCGSEGTSKH
jgi:hypothetical protein